MKMHSSPTKLHSSHCPRSIKPLINHPRRPGHIQLLPCRSSSTPSVSQETSTKPTNPLAAGIASFYDASTGLWEEMWGDHCHHGYYPQPGSSIPQPTSNRAAQDLMIDQALHWAGVTSVKRMVDVGCGLGGSSRYISKLFGCEAEGITLSPFQASRGNQLSKQQGFGNKVNLQVADALEQPFSADYFDLVWSMESGEHMPDKARFVNELARVCAPGGRVIVVTWCHRELKDGETLRNEEIALLDKICDAYYLPAWCSASDYRRLFMANGLEDVKTADWSQEVAPFWGEVIKSALTVQGIVGLFKSGLTTIRGALVMPLMAQGFKMGTIKFALITGVKKS